MLFSDALLMLKNDDKVLSIVKDGMRVIIDRETKTIYMSNGIIFNPDYEDITSEAWEIEK